LGKALAELGRHAEALEAYEHALARDATNRIAERNVERLRVLAERQPEAAEAIAGDGKPEKAPAALFIEEMGKTGHARLINLASADKLAPLSPGDQVVLTRSGDHLMANIGDEEPEEVEELDTTLPEFSTEPELEEELLEEP